MSALRELIVKNRSFRRFDEKFFISETILMKLVDLARLSPNGANLQELKYILSNKKETNEKIFSTLSWAAYLKNWHGPREGEKPSAYIIVLGNKSIKKHFTVNQGIAVQSILLGSVEKGLADASLALLNELN